MKATKPYVGGKSIRPWHVICCGERLAKTRGFLREDRGHGPRKAATLDKCPEAARVDNMVGNASLLGREKLSRRRSWAKLFTEWSGAPKP